MGEPFGGKEVESSERPWQVTWSSSHQCRRGGRESLGHWVPLVQAAITCYLSPVRRKVCLLSMHTCRVACEGQHTAVTLLVQCHSQGAGTRYPFLGMSSTLGSSWKEKTHPSYYQHYDPCVWQTAFWSLAAVLQQLWQAIQTNKY